MTVQKPIKTEREFNQKMKKLFKSRLTLLALIAVMVCALLTSCVTSGTATVNIDGVEVAEDSTLTQEQLNAIATLVRNNSSAWSDFVAAYRGYDVLGADAELDEYPGVKNYKVNVDAAKKVLDKYDTKDTLTYASLTASDVENIVNAMKTTVDFDTDRDLLGNIRYYIGVALKWITSTVGFGNYLLGICVFAVIVEILMLPLAIKQQKNSIKQASLRPKETAIRNHYKGRNDQATQQKVAQEIQNLYEKENFSPFSGCLPMLIQLPIIMILYNVVVDPIQYILGGTASFAGAIKTFFTASRAAGGLGLTLNSTNGTIEVLSQLKGVDFSGLSSFEFFTNSGEVFDSLNNVAHNIPSFNIGPINFGFTPSFNANYALLIVPVLTFLVYYFSMKLSKKFTYQATVNEQAPGQGCSTKAMEFYMPVMSTVFCFMVPGAVGVYWVFRSIISTLKQFIMSRVMPLPQFTEEDYRAAEKEMYSKTPQRKRKKRADGEGALDSDPSRERPRSLHHIDDDDEEYITFVGKENVIASKNTSEDDGKADAE